MRRKSADIPKGGFTLIELMIVLSIACLLIPFSFFTLIHAANAQTMKNFANELSQMIADAQMSALTDNQTTLIIFDMADHSYAVSQNMHTTHRASFDSRIDITTNTGKLWIGITSKGAFMNPGTFLFQLGNIRYKLVMQIGQGRFSIDKANF
ncbi:MAG: type II secretion system protein [Sporolactobacillus sp.]